MVCGNPANHTQRLVASDERVLLGAQGTYEARCRHCFDPTLAAPRTEAEKDQSPAEGAARSRDERSSSSPTGATACPRRPGRLFLVANLRVGLASC